MLLEIHAHTSRYSKCSSIDPVALVRQAHRKGLQGIVITEHMYRWSAEELARLRLECEVENNFLILAAQETRTDIGDILVYGAPRTIAESISLKELRELYPDAALVWAHPFRNGNVPKAKQLLDPMLDAIEVFNTNHTSMENYLALSLWHKYKFTAVSGSDTHSVENAAVFPAQFDHPISDIYELAAEIKNARCKPFLKEIPKAGSNIVVTEITIGTKGADEHRSRLITREFTDKKRWLKAKSTQIVKDAIYESGFSTGTFRVPKTIQVDERKMLLIEEGQRGRNLFDSLSFIDPRIGIEYLRLSAQWLARLHQAGLRLGALKDTVARESKRMENYKDAFKNASSHDRAHLADLLDLITEREQRLFEGRAGIFVQCHGDFHPKNIIIGQDRLHDPTTRFVSAVDFDSSTLMHPAFDVGYFVSQFEYQFKGVRYVLDNYDLETFIGTYKSARRGIENDFDTLTDLFSIRCNISIASFLIKVGKGQGSDMDELLLRSESLKSRLA